MVRNGDTVRSIQVIPEGTDHGSRATVMTWQSWTCHCRIATTGLVRISIIIPQGSIIGHSRSGQLRVTPAFYFTAGWGRGGKTRKTHHSFVFSFMNVLEWLRMFIELRDVYEDNLFLVFSSLKKTRRRHQPRWDEIAKRRLLDLVAAPTFPTCRKGRKHFKLNNHENTKEITKYRTTY